MTVFYKEITEQAESDFWHEQIRSIEGISKILEQDAIHNKCDLAKELVAVLYSNTDRSHLIQEYAYHGLSDIDDDLFLKHLLFRGYAKDGCDKKKIEELFGQFFESEIGQKYMEDEIGYELESLEEKLT